MLGLLTPNIFGWKYTNFNTPSTTPGTSVTPGASNTEGSWTQIASGGNIAYDVYLILLWVSGGNSSSAQKNHLLDIGIDPAGGTSYVERIANIVCGASDAAIAGGRWFYFPFFIKAGSSVAVRIQGDNATAGTVRVGMAFYGLPKNPELIKVAQYSETIGTITGSAGVSFTPDNSGAEGSWVSLGTTTRPLWFWQLCVGISNATITSLMYHTDLAVGDATNKHMIIENQPLFIRGTAETIGNPLNVNGYWEVPAGGTLYVRGSCSGTAVTGFHAVAVGLGG
jgi:hypothetical protein